MYYPGPRALSEPETQAGRRLIRDLRPTVTIWFHQHLNLVDESGGDPGVERRFARAVGLRLVRLPTYPGSATRWENARFPGTTAFVVELPAGRLSPSRTASLRPGDPGPRSRGDDDLAVIEADRPHRRRGQAQRSAVTIVLIVAVTPSATSTTTM